MTLRLRAGRRLRRLLLAVLAVVGITVASAAPAGAATTNISTIPAQYGVNLMCKTYQDSGFGPLWQLSILSASHVGKRISVQVWVQRGPSLVSYVSANGANGSWGTATTFASIILNDVYYVAAGGGEYYDGRGMGYGKTGPYSFSNVAYC